MGRERALEGSVRTGNSAACEGPARDSIVIPAAPAKKLEALELKMDLLAAFVSTFDGGEGGEEEGEGQGCSNF